MSKNSRFNALTIENDSRAQSLKNLIDLIVCEICCISIALIINCIVFFDYFNTSAVPVVFICLLLALVVISLAFRFWKYGIGARASSRIANTLIYAVLITMTIVWLFPFVGIVFESFRVESTRPVGYLIPKEFGFDNYINLFTETDFFSWFGNTAFMGVCTAVLQTFFILSMSYTLSRLRFKGRKLLMNFMLILGMFPGFLTLILIYKVFSDAGLTKDMAPIGLIIVYCASSGMGYYVSKGFFDTIPKSLDEAARVDGATRWQIFYKVIMPLSKPIIIYTILMGFMAPWGDFMLAKYLVANNSVGKTVAVGMWQMLQGTDMPDYYTMFCAAGVVVSIPVTAVFLSLQKYYVEGVTGGAVKG